MRAFEKRGRPAALLVSILTLRQAPVPGCRFPGKVPVTPRAGSRGLPRPTSLARSVALALGRSHASRSCTAGGASPGGRPGAGSPRCGPSWLRAPTLSPETFPWVSMEAWKRRCPGWDRLWDTSLPAAQAPLPDPPSLLPDGEGGSLLRSTGSLLSRLPGKLIGCTTSGDAKHSGDVFKMGHAGSPANMVITVCGARWGLDVWGLTSEAMEMSNHDAVHLKLTLCQL